MHTVQGHHPYGSLPPIDPDMAPDGNEPHRQDIGELLQQILTITDQSLDEAQAR